MAFAGRTGVSVNLDILTMEGEHASDWGDAKNWAEPGRRAPQRDDAARAVQRRAGRRDAGARRPTSRDVMNVLREYGLGACSHIIGKLNDARRDRIHARRQGDLQRAAQRLHRLWSETSWRIARLRDNPACADAEYDRLLDEPIPASRRSSASTRARTSPHRSSRPARVRAWRSCASRASTRISRPPGRCTRPASTRSTCT